MNPLAIATAFVITLNACAPTTQYSNSSDPLQMSTVIDVQNDSPSEVAIYLIRGSAARRLGTVAAQTSAQLRLPREYLGLSQVVIEARSFASHESYMSSPFVFGQRDRVTLRLLQPLASASHAMYSSDW